MDDIRCPTCGSPALVYPRVLEAVEPVACASCGAFVSTYGELKKRSERAPGSNPTRIVSGC
jgi:DNA-directed RNA polymerase subunit N (RpoN/RPB10)